MDIIDTLDKLDSLLSSGKKLPGLGVTVNEKQLREIVRKLRQSVPEDIRKAQRLISDREELINQATREANRIAAACSRHTTERSRSSPAASGRM